MISYSRRPNPRAEYRLRRTEEANHSPTLAAKYPKLKALTVRVDYFDPAGTARQGGMKYKPRLDQAKSLFCINCVHPDCAGADYDLSELIRHAVKVRSTIAEGELRCQGTRYNKERKQERPCESILRYKLTLAY